MYNIRTQYDSQDIVIVNQEYCWTTQCLRVSWIIELVIRYLPFILLTLTLDPPRSPTVSETTVGGAILRESLEFQNKNVCKDIYEIWG